MVSIVVSTTVPLDIGLKLEEESQKRKVTMSQIVREIIMEKYDKNQEYM